MVLQVRFPSGLRLLSGFARFVSRPADLRGWSPEVQPHWEGHHVHPEEQRKPDHPAGPAGGAGDQLS